MTSKGIRVTGTAERHTPGWRCTSAPQRFRTAHFQHPPFDFEHRIVTVQLPNVTVASIYVPNGGKDFAAKVRFLEAMNQFAADAQAVGRPLVMCGDMNVARTDMDVHPKERKPGVVGQRADERALIERILSRGLVDVHRRLDPDNADLFTWWAPWRNRSSAISAGGSTTSSQTKLSPSRATSCAVQREFGTSDHGPVIAVFDV